MVFSKSIAAEAVGDQRTVYMMIEKHPVAAGAEEVNTANMASGRNYADSDVADVPIAYMVFKKALVITAVVGVHTTKPKSTVLNVHQIQSIYVLFVGFSKSTQGRRCASPVIRTRKPGKKPARCR